MSNQTVVDNIELLFDRPREPLFVPKDDGKVQFDVPDKFLIERYGDVELVRNPDGKEVERRVSLQPNIELPNLDFAKPIDIHGSFSLFNTKHQKIAGQLIQLFKDVSESKLLSTAAYCRDRVNPYLFTYALAVTVQHRNDCRHIEIPSILKQFPEQFIDASIIPKMREEEKYVAKKDRKSIASKKDFTASDREPEQRLAYFREDIGINSHHWHWHLVYPTDGPREWVAKDRRGELFYYMHNQIVARYNNERFCNDLERVKALNNLREPINEGYFSKIFRGSNNSTIPGRFSGSVLKDLNRDDATVVEVSDLERWTDRIHQAIDQGFVIKSDNKDRILLNEPNGIDILGNIVEASILSPNPQLYGNLHNMGHNIISYVHDPDNRHLEYAGVMSEVQTAMRDPIFYRWHAFIDSIFVKYKNLLPPYQKDQLIFADIEITSVEIENKRDDASNELSTYWQQSNVNLASGLDFASERVYARFTHLQHDQFEYRINILNKTNIQKKGTCRIFLVPKFDERGRSLNFKDQRLLAIEMDKFFVTLNSGENSIKRSSHDSNVTISYERTFEQIGNHNQRIENQSTIEKFCGCGWPDHMLLPKGSVFGTKFDLFVMISDYEQDRVEGDSNSNFQCNDAYSFCGLKDQKYPDKRAMGYPFDKNTQFTNNNDVTILSEFDQQLPNVKLGQCTIKFNNVTAIQIN